MPTVFSHALVASALASAAPAARRARLAAWAAACAVLPDLDVVAFRFGIPYEHVLGHRGITHSAAFAVALGVAVALLAFRAGERRVAAVVLTLATLSHGLLDMLTDGGHGVALWAPFSAERLFFPVRPVEVSPFASGFFSARGAVVLASEFVWLWAPALTVALVAWTWRRRSAA